MCGRREGRHQAGGQVHRFAAVREQPAGGQHQQDHDAGQQGAQHEFQRTVAAARLEGLGSGGGGGGCLHDAYRLRIRGSTMP
ncbi:hypothetical protein G6F59_018758 [Rhizopus arrhizus]|nr:hypothetical protein G6F59_018758 [Rhizopus arrhizus]